MNIKYLVVHCSDSPNDRDVSAAEIHQWHLQRGWDGIGYHAVIRRNGDIEAGRPTYWMGSHVKDHNHESLGVCLAGRDQFEPAQMAALKGLLEGWQAEHPQAEVVSHHDLNPHKTCPNFDAKAWWQGVTA